MVTNIQTYLKTNLDENAFIIPFNQEDKFPIFLREKYKFYEMSVLNYECIVLEANKELPLVKDLIKHLKQIEKLDVRTAVLNIKTITTKIRRAYIENRIPFIIENGQIFLPFLGLDLKNAPQKLNIKTDKFTTVAQIAYLLLLYDKNRIITAGEFAEEFGYTLMTGSRALKELFDKGLVFYTIGGKTGRTKEYKINPNINYFQSGKRFLRNPIKRTVYIKTIPDNTLVAGLEALAEITNLKFPNNSVRAMQITKFKNLNIETVEEENITGFENLIELQLWEYDPNLFKSQKRVDLASLYATLNEVKDERLEQALENSEIWDLD